MKLHLSITLPLQGLLLLSACSNDGGSSNYVTSFELLDPIAAANNKFGTKVVILPNGNIVVSAPTDSSVAGSSGAVHLYNPYSQILIASFYGNTANDQLGSSITALANNNFVIASPYDDVGGITDAGSVKLVNGSTGFQVGTTLAGDTASDQLGSSSITALANNNFVIASANEDTTVVDGGTVRLVDGSTTGGGVINMIEGDTASDQLGSSSITALANNNFVIASANEDTTVVDGGTVRLVNGSTGVQINMIEGDAINDQLGSNSITALANNNFVIASANEDTTTAVVDGGTVRLVNGSTTGGGVINMIEGDTASDQLGSSSITALANNNFVIASANEDTTTAVVDGGTVRLVNGSTTGGGVINMIEGDTASDQLGSSSITALANNNFVIASPYDDVGGITDAGSVKLVNGSTGFQVGTTLAGDTASDQLGSSSITALANNNFVIASANEDTTVVDGGTVRLVDGSTTGGGVINMIEGDTASDQLGSSSITALANNNFVIASSIDDEGSIVDAGSIRQIDGVTGNQIRTIVGSVADDISVSQVIDSPKGDFYILSLPNKDNNTMVDSGFVTLIARPIFN